MFVCISDGVWKRHGLVGGLLGSILFNDNVLLAGPFISRVLSFRGSLGSDWELGYPSLEFLDISFSNAFHLFLLHYVFPAYAQEVSYLISLCLSKTHETLFGSHVT